MNKVGLAADRKKDIACEIVRDDETILCDQMKYWSDGNLIFVILLIQICEVNQMQHCIVMLPSL